LKGRYELNGNNPLAELMREYLETQDDIKLTNEMRRDVEKGDYLGADRVKL